MEFETPVDESEETKNAENDKEELPQ